MRFELSGKQIYLKDFLSCCPANSALLLGGVGGYEVLIKAIQNTIVIAEGISQIIFIGGLLSGHFTVVREQFLVVKTLQELQWQATSQIQETKSG